MSFDHYNYTVAERFLRYVQIDTQSDPFSESSPSTVKQKDLGKLLIEELKSIGISDAELDDYGNVYATLPANTTKKEVPVICFCSHMDTSPDCSGTNVKPVVHKNYDGGDIQLPDDTDQILNQGNHPELANQKGNDIITASGTTLLGADNKAGLAEIMDAVNFMLAHPEIKHGKIRILFTPDEEIGKGVANVDMKKLGARFGYTMDGETVGSFENENFCADKARIEIHGVSTHTGMAKNKMINALKIAAAFIDKLPKERLSPETTENKEGFLHPLYFSGSVEKVNLEFLVRDFTEDGLKLHEDFLQHLLDETMRTFPGGKTQITVEKQYRNMYNILSKYPQVSEYALDAIGRAGLTPSVHPIRGGTDGAMLTFKGLPSPNIFAGEHAFHSKQEWVSIQDMQKAVQVIVNLCQIWEEQTAN
ncbi:MAG: peptidase T [Chitinophagaceae bacterium]